MTTPGRSRHLFGWLTSVCLLLVCAGPPASAGPVAPGCVAPLSTFVGGTLVGYPDGRALDAHIGVSVGYRDSAGRLHVVMPDGSPNLSTQGDYSWVEHLNPTVAAEGTDDPAATRTWGMCVWGGVTEFYAEVYPKAPTDGDPALQRTDKTAYGSTAYYRGTTSEGQRLNVLLRAPAVDQTGGLQGYVWYRGQPVPSRYISRMRAFPGAGATCGVEGYSAAADQLLTAAGPTRTYYRLDYLSGGQCGAVAQSYSFQVTCVAVCGAPSRTFVRQVAVKKGQWPRFDVVFT